jgi:hypothetical protein
MGLYRYALVLAVSAVAAIAQSPTADFFGELRLTLTSGSDRFEAYQIKSPYANSTGYDLVLRSLAGGISDPPQHVLTMPYDEPKAAYKMGPGTFLVSGRDTANDIAYLCHVSMDTSSAPAQLVLLNAAPQPLSACHAIAYNSTEQVVYALDILTQAVVAAPWVEASPLPLLISSVDLSVLAAGATGALGFGATELSPAVDWANNTEVPGVFASAPLGAPVQSYFWVGQVGGNLSASHESLSASSGAAVGVLDEMYLAEGAQPIVRAPSGQVDIVNLTSGLVVGTASVSTAYDPTTVTMTSPLEAGVEYRPMFGGVLGAAFWPTMRVGIGSDNGTYAVERGLLYQRDMYAGHAEFQVYGRISNIGQAPASTQPFASFLWAKAAEPTGSNVVTLPSGHVLINNPHLTLGPGSYDGSIVGNTKSLAFNVDLTGTESAVGQPLIYQFVVILPDASVLVSDVFGGRLLPALQQAAFAGGGGLTGGEPGNALKQKLKTQSCPNWQSNLIRHGVMQNLTVGTPFPVF